MKLSFVLCFIVFHQINAEKLTELTDCNFCSRYVWKSLVSLNIPMVIITNDQNNSGDLFCNGYIITTNNLTYVKDLFFKQFSFKARARVLIIYRKTPRFSDYEALNRNTYGTDKMILEGFNRRRFKTLQVISVRNKTYLESKGKYVTQKWHPQFEDEDKFNVSVFHCPPFVYYDEKSGVYDGIDLKILQEITRDWPVHFNVYGEDEASPYRAVVLDVLKRKSDVAMCSLWQYVLSGEKLDMSVPYTQHCVTFLVQKPMLLPASTYVFQALTFNLWIVTVIVCFLISGILYLFSLIYLKINKTSPYTNVAYSLLQVLRIITLGSIYVFPSPSQTVFRILLSSWCIYALILSTGYSTGFTTSLTYPRLSVPIKNLQAMVDRNVLWGAKGIDAVQAFENSTSPILQGLTRNYLTNINAKELNLRISRDENFAAIVQTLPGGYVTKTEALDIYALTHLKILFECAQTYLIVFAFPKNSPFREYFDERILKFVEYGLTDHWHREISYKYGLSKHISNFYNSYSTTFEKNPLTLKQLQGAFYLLIAGLFGASLLFIYEFCFRKTIRLQ